jgi:hypothetical protein
VAEGVRVEIEPGSAFDDEPMRFEWLLDASA